MVERKLTPLFVLIVCSCVHTGAYTGVIINNEAQGCFGFSKMGIDKGEPVILTLEVRDKDISEACQCKSALLKYTASQTIDGNISELMTGNFTALNKNKVSLPVSVQSQLIFMELPLTVRIECATN